MDIAPSTTSTTNNNTITNTPTAKSPDQETETPIRIQSAKPLSLTNGVLKRHNPHHHHHHRHHLSAPPVDITYKECLKNHAATLGGHALDGCGEFMPSPTSNHNDPTSIKCAACGCHRNFHRREPEDFPPPANTTTTIEYQPHHRHHPPPPPPQAVPQPYRSSNSASPPPISSSYPSAPHMLLALSGGVSAGLNDNSTINVPGGSSARKRFRTKFSQSQKERMYQFSESIGWKIQKRDEELIQEFCNEVGVDKGVLKVWMHNNKNTFGKRDANGNGIRSNDLENAHQTTTTTPTTVTTNNNNSSENVNHHQLFENDNLDHVGTNGSSSSS
ncbi:hypothetical protein P3X46_029762 [Hevea brasiliensis]|uniref:ZF-HD dimerization-type domain-containing protein n=1 Tax=Hevea brasiliensis TaxID=3981 RepID=A0ABQ9KT86_HEVBR|nr:zinc-finger homeodomain protein 10 [Hevea brasiliensis]KAJ9147625.1 hypothetical protein P3X46_029762 [Hevea brasiliensis]